MSSLSDLEKKAIAPNFTDILQSVKKSLPYQIQPTHIHADLMASIVASAMSDPSNTESGLWERWFKDRGPVYCLSEKIAGQFSSTEKLANLIPADWDPAVSSFLLLLPHKFNQDPLNLPSNTHRDNPKFACVLVAITTATKHLWVSPVEFTHCSVGRIWNCYVDYADPDRMVNGNVYLVWVTRLVLQAALAISFLSHFVDEDESTDRNILYPRWIGRNFKNEPPNSLPPDDRPPVSTYWRKGHWRTQPCGSFNRDRKTIWIPLGLVVPEA